MDATLAVGEHLGYLNIQDPVCCVVVTLASPIPITQPCLDMLFLPPQPMSRITSSFCGSSHSTILPASLGTKEAER